MAFRKIAELKKKSSYVAEQIIDAIKSEKYVGGDKLPPERELAELMGVSRNSVREAVSALQIAGIVQTKVGDGTYISHSAQSKVSQGISWLIESGVDVLDIWKAKEEIEKIILLSAIDRATEEDINSLESILEDMGEAVAARACDKFFLSNINFHLHIAGISGNEPLKRAENSLLRITQQIYRIVDTSGSEGIAQHLERSLATHQGILDTLKTRDKSVVALAMENHFKEVSNFLCAHFGITQNVA